ncbi:MAG: VWA domain-containing protein [Hyphomicrobiaceae bacterium]
MPLPRRRSCAAGLAFWAAILALFVSAWPAAGQNERPRVVVVFDGSGSMWGPVDGRPKVAMAQSSISRFVDLMEGRAGLGIVGYGHRRKGDCRDVEVAFPVGQIDAGSAKGWIGKFSPRGKTPMALAVQTAAEALAADGPGGHIVIVTDGADNCRADPCGVAQELIGKDATLRMHVVILGTTDEDMSKTRCLAETGHGLVEPVATQAELDAAFDHIVAAVSGVAPSDTPAASAETGPPGLRLALRLGPNGPVLTDDLAWLVSRDGTQVYAGATATPALDLAPGSYHVAVTTGGLKAEQTVEVADGEPTRVVLDLGAGIVRLTLVAGAGTTTTDDTYYTVYRADPATGAELATVSVGRGTPPPLLLPAGNYRAVFERGLARIERVLAVGAGTESASEIAFDIGTLKLSARAVEGGPGLDDIYFTVTEDDPEAPGGRREIATSAAAEPVFTLRAGLYHIRIERGAAVAAAEATVRGGEETTVDAVVPSGRLELSSRIAGSPEIIGDLISYGIERLDQDPAAMTMLNGPKASIILNAGRYRITSQYGAGNARAQREVVVAPGVEEAVTIEHEAGLVALAIQGMPHPVNAQWQVKLPDGAPVWASADPSPEIPLSAGDYAVEVRLGARTLSGRFNVAPGEIKRVEVQPE